MAAGASFEGKKSVDKWFPVRLIDDTDFKTPETGKVFGDVTAKYAYEAATSLTAYSVTTDDWKEAGQGNYWLRIGASEFSSEGKYVVSITVSGCLQYDFVVEVADSTFANLIDDLATIDGNVDAVLVDTGTDIPATLATLATAADLATTDGKVDAILVDTGTDIPATLATLATAASLAVTDGKVDTIDGIVDAILVDTGTDIPATLATLATAADLATTDGKVDVIDGIVDAILVDTGTTLDGIVDAIKATTDKLDTTMELDGVGPNYQFTAAAVDQVSATVVGDVHLSANALEDVADAVWDEALAGHTGAGSAGEAAGLADDILTDTGTTLPGTLAGLATAANLAITDGKVDTIDANVDQVLLDIAAVNANVDAVRGATDKLDSAMEADGPVYRFTANGLEEAPVTSTAGLATAAALAVVDANVDAILVDTGTDLPATLALLATAAALAATDAKVDSILTDTGTTLPATLTTIEGKVDTIDGNVDSVLVDTGTTLPATLTTIEGKVDTVDTVVDAVLVDTGTTLDNKVDTIDANVDSLVTSHSTLLADIDALLSAAHGSGAWVITGAGANTVTLTLHDQTGTDVVNVLCVVRSSDEATVLAVGHTNSSGQVVFQLDDGSYKVRYGPSGSYEFSNPYSLTVSGATTQTFTCTTATPVTGGLTYLQLKSNLKLILDRLLKADERFYNEDMVELWINAAYQYIDRKLRWTRDIYQISLVDGTAEYTLPSTVRELLELEFEDSDGNMLRLEQISQTEYLELRESSTSEGSPTHWLHDGDSLFFYPTPDTTAELVRIWHVAQPANLSSDSEVPGFAAHIHQYIIDLALSYALRQVGRLDEAIKLEQTVFAKIQPDVHDGPMQRAAVRRVKNRGV